MAVPGVVHGGHAPPSGAVSVLGTEHEKLRMQLPAGSEPCPAFGSGTHFRCSGVPGPADEPIPLHCAVMFAQLAAVHPPEYETPPEPLPLEPPLPLPDSGGAAVVRAHVERVSTASE